jgi:hypothetical protein
MSLLHSGSLTKTNDKHKANKILNFDATKLIGRYCNTPSVTMAMAHLCTNDCDHMWKKLKEKSIRILETMY